jgi:hypothetical protein
MAAPTPVNELSDCIVTIEFFDPSGNPITPISCLYRVWDDTNKALILDWTSVGAISTSASVDIPGALNALGIATHLMESRIVTFHWTAAGGATRYDSAYYNIIAFPDVP